MHEFKYKRNQLYCESIKLSDVAKKVSTPFYLYSYKTLLDHYYKLKRALSPVEPLICFSMKANSNLAVCKALLNEGAGLDIVSGGELYKALKIGAVPKKIVYASVGKTKEEIAQAIKKRILLFNVESTAEFELINEIAKGLGRKVDVSIRVNPAINPKTHKYVTTSKSADKFGLDLATTKKILLETGNFSNINIIGLHVHIGSQITESEPFVRAIKKIVELIQKLKKKGVNLKWLNIGGGLGIAYREEDKPQTAENFAKRVLPLLKKTRLKIILEPGRFIAGNSGILVTTVVYVKETRTKRFIIVDAGMNDLIRPALYNAYHEILPLRKAQSAKYKAQKYDVVGPICESGDFFAKDRFLPRVKTGDLLAVMGAGAYGFSMASNYNSRPRCAEVMVIKNKIYVVKEPEMYKDLVRKERIPEVLR